eukprot:2308749-Pyramimonas_sp.AAC.1
MGIGTLDAFLVRTDIIRPEVQDDTPLNVADNGGSTPSQPSIRGPITLMYEMNGRLSREARCSYEQLAWTSYAEIWHCQEALAADVRTRPLGQELVRGTSYTPASNRERGLRTATFNSDLLSSTQGRESVLGARSSIGASATSTRPDPIPPPCDSSLPSSSTTTPTASNSQSSHAGLLGKLLGKRVLSTNTCGQGKASNTGIARAPTERTSRQALMNGSCVKDGQTSSSLAHPRSQVAQPARTKLEDLMSKLRRKNTQADVHSITSKSHVLAKENLTDTSNLRDERKTGGVARSALLQGSSFAPQHGSENSKGEAETSRQTLERPRSVAVPRSSSGLLDQMLSNIPQVGSATRLP